MRPLVNGGACLLGSSRVGVLGVVFLIAVSVSPVLGRPAERGVRPHPRDAPAVPS